ncbi:MAG TPA: putative quinol monooxygenase [Bacteroidales bacterium]|nr:putative quinol monooxygenase [Bacteroidales bacterium]
MKSKLLILSVMIAFTALSCKQNTTPQQVETAKPADNQKMIIAKISVKPENIEEFINAAQTIIKNSNEEEGCMEYNLFQSPYNKSNFVFVEKYVNQAAIDFHFGTTYFKEFGSVSSGWTSAPAEIKIYDISGERTAN